MDRHGPESILREANFVCRGLEPGSDRQGVATSVSDLMQRRRSFQSYFTRNTLILCLLGFPAAKWNCIFCQAVQLCIVM